LECPIWIGIDPLGGKKFRKGQKNFQEDSVAL
jgi:hypothetical protein